MPYQKMKKEEMKVVYQLIVEEMNVEQGNTLDPLLLSDFKKLGKEAFKRLHKKSGVKDKRKLKRIFEKFHSSNGDIEKLKNSGKISPNLTTEIRICQLLRCISKEKHSKKRVFFMLNEKYDLKLPKSNGYLQNYRRRHQECRAGTICKFDSMNMSFVNSNFSTSGENSLKESDLNYQDCSNDSFISLKSPFSILESEQGFKTSFGEETCEDSFVDNFEDCDQIFHFSSRLIEDNLFFDESTNKNKKN